MPDIFLSYTRKDFEYTQPIRRALADAGLSVWSEDEIKPEENWGEMITQAIIEVEAVVAVLSPNAKRSKWVYRELSSITSYKKPIFPVLVRGDFEDSVPTPLVNTQIIDLRDDFEEGLERLVKMLNETLAFNQRGGGADSPERSLVLAKEAQELLLNERYLEAIKLAQKALQLDDQNTLALEISAAANLRRGSLHHALSAADKALEIDPENVYVLPIRAETFLELGSFDEAEENAKRALELDEKNTDALRVLAEIELSKGDIEDALEHAERILKIEPYNTYALRTQAEASLIKGDNEQAMDYAQKALDIDPENETARRIQRMAKRKKSS